MDQRKTGQQVLFVLAVGFFFMAVRSMIERSPWLTVGLGFGGFALLLTAALLLRFLHKAWTDRIYPAVCLVLCFLIIPVCYVLRGGMAGGMILFFLIGFFLISTVFQKLSRIILQSLAGLLYLFTLLLSHYWWNPNVKMESEASVSAHIWHLLIAGAVLALMTASYADALSRAARILEKPAEPEERLSFDRWEDMPGVGAMICFSVDNGRDFKESKGLAAYDRAMRTLEDFFLHLTEPGQTVLSYGGDSFVLLVEDVTAVFALEYAQALVREVSELTCEGDMFLKLIFGIHMLSSDEDPVKALRSAEQEMF